MSSLPQRSRALTTSVFWTSTRTPTDGSTRDSSSTARTAWKKLAPGAAVGFGDLDGHHPEVEQLVDERARNLRLLVHFPDERPDPGLGELPDAGPEQPLVLRQNGQGLGVFHRLFGHALNVIIGPCGCMHVSSRPAR